MQKARPEVFLHNIKAILLQCSTSFETLPIANVCFVLQYGGRQQVIILIILMFSCRSSPWHW